MHIAIADMPEPDDFEIRIGFADQGIHRQRSYHGVRVDTFHTLIRLAIEGAGLGEEVAVVTDGQLSGLVNKGLVGGEVTPEAHGGGPLGLVQDGDRITIDVLARRVDVDVASHHPIIDPILGDLRDALSGLSPRRPSIPVIVTTDGDANDDGAISRQEAIDGQRKTFERLDANEDGVLDIDEFAAGQPAPASEELPADVRRKRRKALERQFATLDRDDDGAISLAEYQAAMTPYFDALDTNSDGVLDGAELRQAIEDDSPRD